MGTHPNLGPRSSCEAPLTTFLSSPAGPLRVRVAGVRARVPRAEGGGGPRDRGALPAGGGRHPVPVVALRRHAQEALLPHDAHPGPTLPPSGEKEY